MIDQIFTYDAKDPYTYRYTYLQTRINDSLSMWCKLGYTSDIAIPDHLLEEDPRPEKPEPETLYGAMRMWRMWQIPKGTAELKALTSGHIWEPGENVCPIAPDVYYRGSLAGWKPANSNESGFYGFTDFSEFGQQEPEGFQSAIGGWTLSYYQYYHDITADLVGWGSAGMKKKIVTKQYVIGSTLNYGKIVTATKGARAEKAVPEYLVLSTNPAFNLQLQIVADRYGMRLISLEEAEKMPTGFVPYQKEK